MTLPAPLGLGSAMEAMQVSHPRGLGPRPTARKRRRVAAQASRRGAAPVRARARNRRPGEQARRPRAPTARRSGAPRRRCAGRPRGPAPATGRGSRPARSSPSPPRPAAAPEASAATSSADCSRPQGIAVQQAPSKPARAGAGRLRKIRTGRLVAEACQAAATGAESQPGARPVREQPEPSAIAATCTMPQSGRSIGAAAAKPPSVDDARRGEGAARRIAGDAAGVQGQHPLRQGSAPPGDGAAGRAAHRRAVRAARQSHQQRRGDEGAVHQRRQPPILLTSSSLSESRAVSAPAKAMKTQ